MTPAITTADVTRRNHRQAVRFFWTWLILATWASLAGNVTHAWLTAEPAARWLSVGVAAVPPTVLLLSIHGLAMLAKTTASGAVYRWSVAATATLAAGAFMLSFVALRDLAVIAGIHPALAPVLPLVIDLAIGVATLALVAIGDKPARRAGIATRGARATAAPSATTAGGDREPANPRPASSSTVQRDPATAPAAETAGVGADDSHRELAAELVSAKVTRQPVEVVERILAAHDSGQPLNRIAKDVGVHHSAVSKIINAAQNYRALEVVSA